MKNKEIDSLTPARANSLLSATVQPTAYQGVPVRGARAQRRFSRRVLPANMKNYLKALRAAEMAVWETMDRAPSAKVIAE